MATGIIKNNSVIGVEEEVTEGVYVPPSAATSYIQPLSDGFTLNPAAETIDRNVLNASPGMPTPRLGIRSVTAALPVEFRGSGVEGGQPDFHSLLLGALGASRVIASQSTTKVAGNTSTNLEIEDADIGKYSVGDLVVVLEAGAYEMRPISAVDPTGGAANITLAFPLTNGAPSASVVVAMAQTYLTANDGHPALSLSYYWANEIRETAIGTKVNSMSLDNFTTGQVASFNFGLEGLGFDRIDGAAPHTPVFDSELPPVVLNACMWRNGILIPVNTFSLSLTNTLGFLTDMCSSNGRVLSRVTSREITGSINPHMDDTDVSRFDDFEAGDEFSLFVYAYNPKDPAVAGEFDLGSSVGVWLPNCFTTEIPVGDLDGVLVDDISFKATRGASGDEEEIYIGMV